MVAPVVRRNTTNDGRVSVDITTEETAEEETSGESRNILRSPVLPGTRSTGERLLSLDSLLASSYTVSSVVISTNTKVIVCAVVAPVVRRNTTNNGR